MSGSKSGESLGGHRRGKERVTWFQRGTAKTIREMSQKPRTNRQDDLASDATCEIAFFNSLKMPAGKSTYRGRHGAQMLG